MQAHIAQTSIAPGEKFELTFSDLIVGTSVEIHIYSAATLNRQFAISTAAPIRPNRTAMFTIDTNSLRPGFYELIVARTTTLTDGQEPTVHLVWEAKTLQERVLFEVAKVPRALSKEAILREVLDIEAEVEHDFLEPVQAVFGLTQPAIKNFTAFVFVRGMLIGTRLRFRNYEIVPAQNGLDDIDTLNNVNHFLKERTSSGVTFPYSPERSARARQTNPVCIFHFPAVLAISHSDVRGYAESLTDKVLLALALTRDASGSIFDCVVVEHGGGAISYARGGGYVGNLLTGWLAGESPETIESFASQLGRRGSDRLLVSLYKDARSETSADFQYVRLWTVLEALADAREYDANEPLLDFEGKQMSEGTKALKLTGGVSAVFCLMRESGLGSTERNWKLVNTWFAFRTAVAHHGSRLNYAQLQRPHVRGFAERASEEIQAGNGHDSYLWELKEDTKLLLMRRLNGAAPWR